jgi:hypothetical protein
MELDRPANCLGSMLSLRGTSGIRHCREESPGSIYFGFGTIVVIGRGCYRESRGLYPLSLLGRMILFQILSTAER